MATTPTGAYSLLATTVSPTYIHSGLGDGATRYYKVAAYDNAGNQSAQTDYSVATTASQATILWQDGWESGNNSAWDAASTGGVTVLNNSEAYNGTYHLQATLVNGSANDKGLYRNYGTPGQLATQVRNFSAQCAISFDSFTGAWNTADPQKLLIFQFYDSTYNATSFSNSLRKFQVLLNVAQAGTANAGQYQVQIYEFANTTTGAWLRGGTLVQNTTSYGPANSFGSWDVLRLQVQLDTNGTGNLGAGNGNGIVRLWRNNELILEYTNVNVVGGNANVGMGRFLIAPGPSGTWAGSSTSVYYDRFQVASAPSALDTMPSSAVPRVIVAAPVVYRIPFSGTNVRGYGAFDNAGVQQGTMAAFVNGYNDGTLDGPNNGTNECQRTGFASGGYLNRGFMRFQWWNLVDRALVNGHTLSCNRFSGYGTEAQPKFARFRVRWVEEPGPGCEGKFAFDSAGGGSSGDRMLIQHGNASTGIGTTFPPAGTASQAMMSFAQNISDNGTYIVCDRGVWYNVQVEYLRGVAAACYFKVWQNNNTYASPTRQFGPARFSTDWRQGAHYTADAQMWWGPAQGHRQSTHGFTFDIQEVEFGLQFDPNWHQG